MKPIDRQEFWEERISDSIKRGELRHSVYVTHKNDWVNINYTHEGIIRKLIPKGDMVLDAGCGYGRWAFLFPNYTGMDFSKEFIRMAKDMNPKKEFVCGNLKEIPFDDGTFDWAICVSIRDMVIDNLGEEEWQRMFQELKRVANKVLILEYTNPEKYEVI